MKKNYILTACVLVLSQILIAQAQDEAIVKGTETAQYNQSVNNEKCLVFGKYVVKTVSGEDVGEEIEVYRRVPSVSAEAACESDAAPYYTIKNADANYFAGLSGDYLFVDSGTSADSRGLEIFNLKSKKSIFSTEYFDPIEIQQGRFVIYDKTSTVKGAIKTCREAAQWKKDGLTVGWVKQAKLDLQTLKETPTGAIRCRAFE